MITLLSILLAVLVSPFRSSSSLLAENTVLRHQVVVLRRKVKGRIPLTYDAFPDIHWQKIRTKNPLERIMRESRRRTRVVGAFPDGQSCLNLAAARLRYIAGTAWSTKRYMNMRPLYQPQTMQTGAVA
jgi:hypothetical protein